MDIALPSIDPKAFVAPTASIFGDVVVHAEAVVMFGAVLRAERDRITVGPQTNLQDGVVLHVDERLPCTIGRRVSVGHGAVVHGATVGDHALVGIRAVALNGSEIGEGAWLAAGAILAPGERVSPWTLAMGIPARIVRDLTDEEIQSARDGVDSYLGFAEAYRRLFSAGGAAE